ncbi:Cyclin-dependent kinase catalytic subunit [Dispira parvispora]|uniref:RNA helicase n=1 Tax=Dispira parvispora TaxID=1520584 RepID=A0A9W8ATG5_9FUNG|nr:Cyclin-dependent kinase catalytic subunit [Dispira parvispora]
MGRDSDHYQRDSRDKDRPRESHRSSRAQDNSDSPRRHRRDRDRNRAEPYSRRSTSPRASQTSSSRRDHARTATSTAQPAVSDLRVRARQEYLRKREKVKLEVLEKQIAEEESLFSETQLTNVERTRLETQRELLRLARERKEIETDQSGYAMPEDYLTEQGKIDRKRKEQALYQRYQEPDREGPGADVYTGRNRPTSELDQWEAQQIARTKLTAGALEKTKPVDHPGKTVEEDVGTDYDFLLDEAAIDFVLESTLNPQVNEEDRKAQELLDEVEKRVRSIEQVRKSLPVYSYRQQLLDAIEQFQVLIIEGETGSGKTTQIPQYLFEAGYTRNGQKIGCTQPRRVAAMSVAARVAEEMGVRLGHEVGYAIRFEDCTSDKTIMKYMTDGMLLREFLTEPDLASYSCLMIDEAHERTLSTDILFGLVKDITRYRPDLKVLIASATMDAQKFSEYFDDAPIFKIPGRPYPVDIYYTKAPEANYLQAAVTTILQIHVSQARGDILVFLTGQDEIETAQEHLQQAIRALGSRMKELIICPIYANLPSELQAKIFEPTPENARKVVLATNIAETSITIDGVVYVIDPGFVKMKTYEPRTEMESLVVAPCSRNAANQRAGRAGRVGPGKCFRLYTQWAYLNELPEHTIPEIQRSNLSMVVLQLMSLGINNLVTFDYIDPPPVETVKNALAQLYDLGALSVRGEVTKTGRQMAELPLDPKLAKALVASSKYHCSEEVITICALLGVHGALFYRPKDKKIHAEQAHKNLVRPGGDHFTLLNLWEQWSDTDYSMQWCYENFIQYRSLAKARDIRDQLVGLLERIEVPLEANANPADTTGIAKSLLSGFFGNVARRQRAGDNYRIVKRNDTVLIHPSSSLREDKPPWVLYYELVLTSQKFIRVVMEIQPKWLLEIAPHVFKPADIFDESKKKMPKTVGKSSSSNTQ